MMVQDGAGPSTLPMAGDRTTATRLPAAPGHVTVGVATRDRDESIAAALSSLAASSHESFDVIVVDQSHSDTTEAAVRRFVDDDARFSYVRSSTTGLSAARNEVIARSSGGVVAFTDDDCIVSPGWLETLAAHFRDNSALGMVFGEVRAAPFDAAAGFIPIATVKRPRRIRSPWLKWREKGIGANMAIRADVLALVGPFDPKLGAGATFMSGEDFDMAYRVLKAGFEVQDVRDAAVVHTGFRDWQAVHLLMWSSGVGSGAAYAKHLRMGDVAVLPTLAHEWAACISWRRLLTLRRGSGLGCFLGFANGMMSSFSHPIDTRSRTYVG